LLPDDSAPQPDELTEHLADFRGGDEVAGAADRQLPAIIPMLGIVQTGFDVVGDADGAVAGNAPGELLRQRRRRALCVAAHFKSRVRAR
jgi:hypothetical protein